MRSQGARYRAFNRANPDRVNFRGLVRRATGRITDRSPGTAEALEGSRAFTIGTYGPARGRRGVEPQRVGAGDSVPPCGPGQPSLARFPARFVRRPPAARERPPLTSLPRGAMGDCPASGAGTALLSQSVGRLRISEPPRLTGPIRGPVSPGGVDPAIAGSSP